MAVLPLKDIPNDVKSIILDVQVEIKKEKKISQFGQPQTIYHIIREYFKMKTKGNAK